MPEYRRHQAARNGALLSMSPTAPPPDDRFHVEHRTEGTAVVVRAVGDVDMRTAPVLADQLTRAAEAVTPPAPLVADFRELRFFGSSGLSALLTAHQQCQQRAIPLRIVPGPIAARRLSLLGVIPLLTICPTVTDALHTTTDETDLNPAL